MALTYLLLLVLMSCLMMSFLWLFHLWLVFGWCNFLWHSYVIFGWCHFWVISAGDVIFDSFFFLHDVISWWTSYTLISLIFSPSKWAKLLSKPFKLFSNELEWLFAYQRFSGYRGTFLHQWGQWVWQYLWVRHALFALTINPVKSQNYAYKIWDVAKIAKFSILTYSVLY